MPVVVDTARITSSDRSATFLVLDEPALRSLYNLELVDPHGQIIILGTTVGGVPVHRMQRHTYTLYRVVFPALEQASTYVGDWVLRLTPTGEWRDDAGQKLLRSHASSIAIAAPSGVVPVGFAAAVASNYRMNVEVTASPYLPGAEVTMLASLTDRGWPSLDGSVHVDVTAPDGTLYADIVLFDDGTHSDVEPRDGTWTNRFIQTSLAGTYKFFFHALGYNERGELAPREATRHVSLVPPSPDPKTPYRPCIPCRLQRLLWALVIILLLLLLLCCCRRTLKARVG
jgi:hypothetical protein